MDLVTKLKQYRPAKVIAYDQDDEAVTINVPDVRKKFERVLKALDDVAWVRLDLQDKKGGHLARHIRQAEDTEPTMMEDLARGASNQLAVQLAPLVQIMLRAQEVAIVRNQSGQQQLLDASLRMLEVATRKLDLQEKKLEAAIGAVHQLTADLLQLQAAGAVAAQHDEGDKRPMSDRVVEQLLPGLIRSAMSGGDEPTSGGAKNGAPSRPRRSQTPPVPPDQAPG